MRFPPPLVIGPLDEKAAGRVRDLVAAATDADGVAPLSEQALLSLTTDSATLTHAVARNKTGVVVGYAQIDRGGDVASAEIVVHPDHRRRGTGKILLRVATRDATLPSRSGEPGDARKGLRVWAHGDLPAARGFAAATGLVVVRELLVLERPLGPATPPTADPLPATMRLRPFDPATDAPTWVDLNARAFAGHPEQGRLTAVDLAARQREDWYDPAGLAFLTEADNPAPLGYIWTKVATGQPEDTREGEIYAVGVDPAARGRGLGRVLLEAGLAHLAAAGAKTAILYVDGDNEPALRLYDRAGFTRRTADVQYAARFPGDGMTHEPPEDATMKS